MAFSVNLTFTGGPGPAPPVLQPTVPVPGTQSVMTPAGQGQFAKSMAPAKNLNAKVAKVDHGMPKKPLSGYFFFSTSQRRRLKEEKPELDFGGLSKELGRRWALLPPDQRKPYEQMAEDDRDRYATEVKTYKAHSKRGLVKKAKAKAKTENKAVRRPTTAFFFFAKDKRPEIKQEQPGLKVTEVAKALGQMWREMSVEDKRQWTDLADADKQRYEEQLREYEAGKVNDNEANQGT